MFFATALLYPCVLAALCLGAGLLADRVSGDLLPSALLLTVGAATLIALSQLTTYVPGLAPVTPYAMAVAAVAGFGLARDRLRDAMRRMRRWVFPIAAGVVAYLIALAPVLLSGRASFSSYMALADSAVHMLGADYLLRHGQHYASLDLRNSYGQFVNNYYNTSYPSGADTLFGGSSFLLGLPLIWSFQPFNAFMLACAVGPAWLLARKLGLDGALAALASLTTVLPALVYAYELFGSIKEVTALSMILTLGCLVAHRSWLRGGARGAIPFALVLAGGTSALGVAFGAWALAPAVVLAAVLAHMLFKGKVGLRATGLLVGASAAGLAIAAWPTWRGISGSLRVAQNIASTVNPGNLHSPLRAIQGFGVWLNGSYKLAPSGAALTLTHALIALMLLAAVLGAAHLLVRLRAFALAGWLGSMLLVWFVVSRSVTTWASAKTLMLTSPVLVLMAWGGVAALKSLPSGRVGAPLAALLAVALAGGVLASDAMQYRASNLAPTARYEELASLNARFAGRGPALLTDFDEYALYELRDLDVGGADFVYPPAALRPAAPGYGDPVNLDRVAPTVLEGYPLIVTRRDPSSSRPPAAYRLLWQGTYYEVWQRRARAAPALRHVALVGAPKAQCASIGSLAQTATSAAERLVASQAPELIRVSLAQSQHPRGWGHERHGLVMSRPGQLQVGFTLPHAGRWNVWVQGQIMPTVALGIDGRRRASISGELDGNSLVPNTGPPISVALGAGMHRVTLTRAGFGLTPGSEGSAVLDGIFLIPARQPEAGTLRSAPAAAWRSLCGGAYQWVELTRAD
jgi:hypothetical protein